MSSYERLNPCKFCTIYQINFVWNLDVDWNSNIGAWCWESITHSICDGLILETCHILAYLVLWIHYSLVKSWNAWVSFLSKGTILAIQKILDHQGLFTSRQSVSLCRYFTKVTLWLLHLQSSNFFTFWFNFYEWLAILRNYLSFWSMQVQLNQASWQCIGRSCSWVWPTC